MSAAPFVTVAHLTLEGLGSTTGPLASWLRRSRAAPEPPAVGVLDADGGSGRFEVVPDVLLPLPDAAQLDFDDQLERVAAVSEDDLLAALAEAQLLGTKPWTAVVAAPGRWLDEYLAALRGAWAGLAPWWERATPLMEREVERVGAALVRGTFDELLAGIRAPYDPDTDRPEATCGSGPARVAPTLALVPMIVAPTARSWHRDRVGRLDCLAYPLPGVERLTDVAGIRRSNRATGLDALIGSPRAEILRRLDDALPAGQLARDMLYAPSVITHHLRSLERAGLITRERRGRLVLVQRSARGTSLLHLYEW